MKTINGAPQFEENEVVICTEKLSNGKEIPDVDTWTHLANCTLQEWAESRRCVRCAYMEKFTIDHYPKFRCNYLGHNFGGNNIYPETFSCASFEEKK